MRLPTGCSEMRVAIRLGSPADQDLGYTASDHDLAMGLTRDSHSMRRASPNIALVLTSG
jgi:hypothetical protein